MPSHAEASVENMRLLEIPHRVDDGVDSGDDIVAEGRNLEGEFAGSGEFLQEVFGIEEPRIGQAIGWKTLGRIHRFAGWKGRRERATLVCAFLTSVVHEGHSLRFYMTYIV